MKWLRDLLVGAFALGILGIGAQQALAAGLLMSDECDTWWNNCAPSRGGDENCTYCCTVFSDYDYGICFSYEEGPNEGCLCGFN